MLSGNKVKNTIIEDFTLVIKKLYGLVEIWLIDIS